MAMSLSANRPFYNDNGGPLAGADRHSSNSLATVGHLTVLLLVRRSARSARLAGGVGGVDGCRLHDCQPSEQRACKIQYKIGFDLLPNVRCGHPWRPDKVGQASIPLQQTS